jgi:hypothetical protein
MLLFSLLRKCNGPFLELISNTKYFFAGSSSHRNSGVLEHPFGCAGVEVYSCLRNICVIIVHEAGSRLAEKQLVRI